MLKNLSISFCLSATLLLFGLFVFMPKSEAQGNLLPGLIDVPAPPPPNPLVKQSNGERSPEFYRKDNPPPDDAPIEDLLDYWKAQRGATPLHYVIDPSPRVLDRLLNELGNKPENIIEFLDMLKQRPEAVDVVKRAYDLAQGNESSTKHQKEGLENWLMYNSDYFSDRLLQLAQEVRDQDEYVTNQEELLALARVDWDKARPLLDRMLNDQTQPISRTLANWAYYMHALGRGNSIEASGYRDALMRVVEDKSTLPGNRDLAFDALVYGGDFPGRDDWYFTLMEDETLHDLKVNGASYTGLTTLLLRSPPDQFVDKMVELVKSSNAKVRSAAVKNLMSVLKDNNEEKAKAVLTALLPWLEDPNWAKQISNERQQIVSGLARVEIPESVPGLIAVMNEKSTIDVDEDENGITYEGNYAANTNYAGRATPNGVRTREVFPFRNDAIRALMMQKSVQAASALRQVLPEVESWQRDDVIKAILISGGFTVAEQVEGLELFAKITLELQVELEKQRELANTSDSVNFVESNMKMAAERIGAITRLGSNVSSGSNQVLDQNEIKMKLGGQVATIGVPGNELVSAVVYRLKYLETNDRPVAELIRSYMQNWHGDAVNAILLDDLGSGKSTLNAIVKLLGIRKELRQNHIPNIYDARAKGNPIAYGISACLLEDYRDYDAILSGAPDDVKIAMLGCARLIRAQIPIPKVEPFLKSTNKLMALAAERYIESEDSQAARRIIYSLYPNEAKITGAKFFFGDANLGGVDPNLLLGLYGSVTGWANLPPYYSYSMFLSEKDPTEEKLRKEIKEDEKLLGIYAYDKNFVRIFADKAVFSWEEDEARYLERKLNESEFGYLKSYLASNDVDNLPPFVSYCGGCRGRELLMLGKQGGRRVFLYSNPTPKFFEGLEGIFDDMKRPPATLRYYLEKDIAGLQILFADKDLEAEAVWKNGGDLRVLINNVRLEEQIESEMEKLSDADYENDKLDYEQAEALDRKRRAERAFASYSWHHLLDGKLGGYVNQPTGVDFITRLTPDMNRSEYSEAWSVKSGNVEVRLVEEDLLKVVNGRTTKLNTGYYSDAVITENGKWVVLTKFDYDSDKRLIVKINLQTNRETVVKFDTKLRFSKLVAFIPSVNKVLLTSGNSMDYRNDRIENGSHFLLDPDTGVVQPVKGEFRPIIDQTYRKLQKTAVADEVWAAIPEEGSKKTQIGIYNVKTFAFKPVLDVPQIAFKSMDMWVDESENKVFIVYNGQLLAIPLKKVVSEISN